MDLAVTEEFRQLLSRISDFVKNTLEPISLQVETEEKIPEEIIAAIRKLDLFGMMGVTLTLRLLPAKRN